MIQSRYIKKSRVLTGIVVTLATVTFTWAYLAAYQDQQDNRGRIESLYNGYRQSFPQVPDILARQLHQMRNGDNVVLIDVREDHERRVSMIPGAISARQFEENSEHYRDAVVVIYCTIGYRSGFYTQKLRENGFQKAYNLKGGILLWIDSGQPLNNENGHTLRVHVYGKRWNLVPQGYQAVW